MSKEIITFKLKEIEDSRGDFTKFYDSANLPSLDNVVEIFKSSSLKNTIRGMHFQKIPYNQNKIVICSSGKILDVIVNIDYSDKNFGRVYSFTLEKNQGVYIPNNYAHGFLSLIDSETIYFTDKLYSKNNDTGVLWNSIDFEWPVKKPIISNRDINLPKLASIS